MNSDKYILTLEHEDGTRISHSFSRDLLLPELLQQITYFLNGCSWSYIEKLEAVTHGDPESECLYRREHREILDSVEVRYRTEKKQKRKK